MKEYPVTSRELWTLGGIQATSALALSVSGWLFGFWANAKQAVEFADETVTEAVLGRWEAYGEMAFWGAIGVGALGLVLIGLTGFNVWGIIRDTKHD